MKIQILLFMLIAFWAASAHSGLYRWVDESGKVHYGDQVPPEYAQNGHTKLHKNGLTKEKVDSLAERKRKREAIHVAKERLKQLKERQREQDLQEMRDTQLLSMFSNVEELEMVYQSKLEMADGGISILQARHKKLSETLEGLEAKHEKMLNPNDKNMLALKIDDILDNLNIYQQAITDNQIERKKIAENYKIDLVRFVKISVEQDAKKSASNH